MSKAVKPSLLLLAVGLLAICAGCAHKPAYSDIDANKNARNQNQNNAPQASPSAPDVAAPQASPEPAPAPPAAKPAMPAFLDVSGSIKDLPAYPRARRTSVQMGPMQEAIVMTLSLHTSDPMEKVQAFYTQVIKENQWTVTDKLLDPEVSEWTLKKDDNNNAKVQAKKDPKTNAIDIYVIRAQKFAPQSK